MPLVDIIAATDPAKRNLPLAETCAGLTYTELLAARAELDTFRQTTSNLYERVRALTFLAAINRYHLPARPELNPKGVIPYAGVDRLLNRRFDEAIRIFCAEENANGPSDPLCSALAAAYQALAFQTLADQVRQSVRSVPGNRWMFRCGSPEDHPLRIRPELLHRTNDQSSFPILRERTPVRMDLSHSGWSDIFFLGMDYPEGAKVINVSIDLAVRGKGTSPKPPVEVYLRVIDTPVLRLVSTDLNASADVSTLEEVFDFARDYLGLLKAAVIAAGIIPPGLEGARAKLEDVLAVLVGPGLGLELVSSVNDIPKGSRLAVSTNLLAGLIAVCMRATGQARNLTGTLNESERRLVAARAILGEWLGGSGGGWQDSGGVWPAIKLIEGTFATETDPEHGISRGTLLPQHTLLGPDLVPTRARQNLEDSLVLVHGGMAQNVGPILEMVTEKYLLREKAEWDARQNALGIFEDVKTALASGDVQALGSATTRNFFGPLQTIIPAATNHFTESLIANVKAHFGKDFWGFWMLGGMSGGGMGFMVNPARKPEAQAVLAETMTRLREELRNSLPFAMDPVVYDFAINPHGTFADLLAADDALLPKGYYALLVPRWLKEEARNIPASIRTELGRVGHAARTEPAMAGLVESIFDRVLPAATSSAADRGKALQKLLEVNGFDREAHERIRTDLKRGRIGLAQNRLPANTIIEDVKDEDIYDARLGSTAADIARGTKALQAGEVAVVTLSAGAGSRWTQGAGVVKALHPFAQFLGKHRTFLDVHLAKTKKTSQTFGAKVAHVFTTGYLTHEPILAALTNTASEDVHLSPGLAVGLRLIPTERDLRFAWEETAHQVLDEQKQKMRESGHAALIGWAKGVGEGSDYTDNEPLQCMHPVGHGYEIPNLLRNGTLQKLLKRNPGLKYLLVHNVDTLGANLDAGLLGWHIRTGNTLNFEMIGRRIDDRGGGLARVNGKPRILEGLAMPREDEEFTLSYYNSLTTWVTIDSLLETMGLVRADLEDTAKVNQALSALTNRLPTYITLKDVKKRWGKGHEDVFPVCQFEKLWGDMSALPDVPCGYVVVPRPRGQQLKDIAQLDGWLRDGTHAFVQALAAFEK